MLNENALSNILVDVDFLEGVFKKQGREHVNEAFTEIRLVCLLSPHFRIPYVLLVLDFEQMTSIALQDKVQEYLVPSSRQSSYAAVKPKRLQALLEKLAKFGASTREPGTREAGEKRRKEAEAVGRIFPGEGR